MWTSWDQGIILQSLSPPPEHTYLCLQTSQFESKNGDSREMYATIMNRIIFHSQRDQLSGVKEPTKKFTESQMF